MRRDLYKREFPDIDRQLHCVAVKVADELEELYRIDRLDSLSPADVKKMADLVGLLLLIRKQITKTTDKPTHNSSFEELTK